MELPLNLTEVSSSIILYGNQDGADVDLLSVAKGGCGFKHEIEGKWDLVLVGRKHFVNMLYHFDPVVTEPILTGEEVQGNELSSWRMQLLESRVEEDDIDYLFFSSGIFLDWAKDHIKLKSPTDHIFLNLVFALSFNLFAEHYRQSPEVITLSKLLEGESLGINLMRNMREKRRSPKEEKQELIRRCLGLLFTS